MPPLPQASSEPPRRFHRGKSKPRGVVWFGINSFWGHMQHFLASAIATEDIDSRDWMRPNDPEELLAAVGQILRAKAKDAPTLTEALDRDLWIDFLADTGDDPEVSTAMARIVFAEHEVLDGEEPLVTPRGDLLIFGGDTAYPVATAREITDRVVAPFNRVLGDVADRKKRVLLGIPGNHDWYDGLDGFGRLFRKRLGELAPEQLTPQLTPGRETQLLHVVEWVQKFVRGRQVKKQRVLVIDGYEPVQRASYFALPLAPGLDLFAVDRQLRTIDYRQQSFFADRKQAAPDARRFVMLPDPVYSFLRPSPTGVDMAESLDLDLETTPHLVLAGDIHHYERRTVGASLHVVAGGGGAFMHASLSAPEGAPAPAMQWPGVPATQKMLLGVPLHVAIGKAGFLPHLVFVLLFGPALGVGLGVFGTSRGIYGGSVAAGVVGAIVCALIGGVRQAAPPQRRAILWLSLFAGVSMALLPPLAAHLALKVLPHFRATPPLEAALTLLVAAFSGSFVFGGFLAALTWLGLEGSQAFTSLGVPGYRHFVRIRVRRDGSAVDGWVIGLLDPLAPGSKPALVDHWTFRPRPP